MSPIAGVHWSWTAWLADQLDAIVYVVPYPLAPINTVHEVRKTITSISSFFCLTREFSYIYSGSLRSSMSGHRSWRSLRARRRSSQATGTLSYCSRLPSSRFHYLLSFLSFLSAGAVLSLCLANAAHAASLPLPHHIIAVSPAANLDLFALDAEMRLIEPNDPLLHISTARRSRRLWLGLPLDSPTSPSHLPSSPTHRSTLPRAI